MQARKAPVMIAITRVILLVVARLRMTITHIHSLSPLLLTGQPAGRRLLTVKAFSLLAQPLLAHLDQDGQPDHEDQDKGDEEGDDRNPPTKELLKH